MIGTDFAVAMTGGLVKATDTRKIGEAVSSTMHLREAWILNMKRKSGKIGMEPEVGSAVVQVFEWDGRSWSLGQSAGASAYSEESAARCRDGVRRRARAGGDDRALARLVSRRLAC